jgi:uncharacterized protein involved in exopolysaccharide biosynthesis
MNDATNRSARKDGSLDVRSALRLLLQNRLWILVAIVVSTVVFTAVALLMTPIYRATTVMIPVSAERNNLAGSVNSSLGSLGGLASLAGLNLASTDTATAEAVGVLRSRQFAEDFIVDHKLMPQLFAKKWDASTQNWKPTVHAVPTIGKAVKYFDKSIRKVVQDTKTPLITLQIDWRDRQAAAAWANELVMRVNAEMRERAISTAAASIAFLEKELATTSVVETRDAISRLIEAQEKQRMLANVTEQYAFRVVDPASVPDADDPVMPPKLLLLIAGPLVGLALGIACVLIFQAGDDRAAT